MNYSIREGECKVRFPKFRLILLAVSAVALMTAAAAEFTASLKPGKADLKSNRPAGLWMG